MPTVNAPIDAQLTTEITSPTALVNGIPLPMIGDIKYKDEWEGRH